MNIKFLERTVRLNTVIRDYGRNVAIVAIPDERSSCLLTPNEIAIEQTSIEIEI